MHSKNFVLGIVSFVVAFSTVFLFNLSALFFTLQVSAQTLDERKAEADRLNQQGLKQVDASQFEAALQSFQQALTFTFEDWNLHSKIFDLAISAQAFHWVNRKIGCPR